MNIGNFLLGVTFDKKFTTRTAAGTPIVFAGSPALTIYKDNVATPSAVGLTLTTSFNSRPGINNVRIVTTDAFFIAGNYEVVVTAGTVDGVSVVDECIFSFSLEARYPAPTLIADTLLKRDWVGLTGEASRSMLNALRPSRNKWAISGGIFTAYKEDDTTIAWSGPVTTASGNPLTSIDPT